MSLIAARRLFAAAPTPVALAGMNRQAIDRLIGGTTFHRPKAAQIRLIAREAVARYGGELPCDESVLLGFRGVGLKCAHLALGIACGERRISVDLHVHRVTNRWGYVAAATPEATMASRHVPAGRGDGAPLGRDSAGAPPVTLRPTALAP